MYDGPPITFCEAKVLTDEFMTQQTAVTNTQKVGHGDRMKHVSNLNKYWGWELIRAED